MKKRHIFLIILLFIVFLSFFRVQWMNMFNYSIADIKDGHIDLRDWDSQENSVVHLDGEWEFYPSQLLMDEPNLPNVDHSPKNVISVPDGWNDYLTENGSTPYGYGSYRVTMQVDPNMDGSLKLDIPSVRSASEIYINGDFMGSSGKVAKTEEEYEEKNLPYSVTFTPDENSQIDIIIQVANFKDIRQSGIVRSITFGTEQAITKETNLSLMMQILASSILLIHSIYAIILYFLGKLDKRFIYFSVILLSLTIVNMVTSDEKLLHLIIDIDYDWGFRLSNGFGVLTVFLLFTSFHHHWLKRWQIANQIFSALFIIIIITTFFLSAGQIITLYPVYMIFVIPSIIILFITIFNNIFKNLEHNLLLLLSIIAFFHQLFWFLYWRDIGINIAYYPFDFIIAITLFSSVWFKEYFRTNRKTKELAIQLQEIDENRDQFLANTAHEFKNPLHSIINMSQSVLGRDYQSLGDQSARELETVLSVSRRLSLLLNDLLDVTAFQQGKPRLKQKKVTLQPLVIGVIDMLQFKVDVKPVKLINQVPDNFPSVFADENRLIQIIYNLLDNAIKFTNEGSITIEAIADGDQAIIKIIDSGIGMDEDFLEKLFLPYEQSSERTITTGGLGLGLHISKQLVELHGGQLHVTSTPNKGTTFTFSILLATEKLVESEVDPSTDRYEHESIPIQENVDADNTIDQSINYHTNADITSVPKIVRTTLQVNEEIKILLVDDDPINLQVIQSILQDDLYEITGVLSGEDALIELADNEWDIVISDIMMPNMSGFELTKKIREKYLFTELPILLLTARDQPRDIHTGFLAGANDYVTKPVDMLELSARVNALTMVKYAVKKRLQLESSWLQAQIKPHFIFNTLNSILALSNTNVEKMREVLYDLSNYLRHKFQYHDIEELIPINDELNIIRSYVKIEQIRFKDRLQVEWNIQHVGDIKIPFLSIQPLVENAITHGIMKKVEGGKIIISITDHGDYAKISVQDNGVGMDENKLIQIFEISSFQQASVGIINTNKRIIQHFGEGLQYKSKENEGTTVYFIVKK